MSSRSLRESSPTLGVRMAITGRFGLIGQLLQILRRETIAHVGERGQAQVRLVDAVEADGFVIIHAREWRLDFGSGGVEGGGEKSFDHFPDAFGLRDRTFPDRSE